MPNFEWGHVENTVLECWNVRRGTLTYCPHFACYRPILSSLKLEDSAPGSNLGPSLLPAALIHSLLLSVLLCPTPFLWSCRTKKESSVMALGLLYGVGWGGKEKGEEDHLACSGANWWVLRQVVWTWEGRRKNICSMTKGHFWSVS